MQLDKSAQGRLQFAARECRHPSGPWTPSSAASDLAAAVQSRFTLLAMRFVCSTLSRLIDVELSLAPERRQCGRNREFMGWPQTAGNAGGQSW